MLGLWGKKSRRPLAIQISDAWYFLRHPVEFYREIWLERFEWRAQEQGQTILKA